MSKNFCIDMNGEKVFKGDFVKYYPLLNNKNKEEPRMGKVWIVGDMNKEQTNMPYLKDVKGKNIGAWHPKAIEKINS